MLRRFIQSLTAVATVIALLAGASYGLAAEAKPPVAMDKQGHAISGYDAVSYFSGTGPTKGNPEFSQEWNGAVWLFATAANRDAFAANPEAYAPQFGGYCAWAITMGQTAKADPRVYEVYEGELYMNLSKGVQKKWQKNRTKSIAAGRNNWPEALSGGSWTSKAPATIPAPDK